MEAPFINFYYLSLSSSLTLFLFIYYSISLYTSLYTTLSLYILLPLSLYTTVSLFIYCYLILYTTLSLYILSLSLTLTTNQKYLYFLHIYLHKSVFPLAYTYISPTQSLSHALPTGYTSTLSPSLTSTHALKLLNILKIERKIFRHSERESI